METKDQAVKKLRMHFNTNAMWSTSGYGQQSCEFIPKIRDMGYPVAMTNYFGLQGGKIVVDGIVQYPVINHVYGSDALVLHGKDFKADVNFSFQDIWVLNPQDLQQVNRWIPIVPIDRDPVPEVVWQRLKFAYRIVTYSKFGHESIRKLGFHSTYIPHTVDTSVFKPMDKKERKRSAGLPEDSFLIGMVAANKDNPPRKSFQEVIDAFVMFLKKEPKALLYIHTNPEFPGGFPIRNYARFLGIQDKIIFPDVYEMNYNTNKEKMALIYNTFDVFVMPSISEGFGIGLIEAQACGVPAITLKWTAMEELVIDGETGFLCEISQKRWDQAESYVAVPSIQSIYECLSKVHEVNRIEMGKKCRKQMVEHYDSERVFIEKWAPFVEQLEKEIYPDI